MATLANSGSAAVNGVTERWHGIAIVAALTLLFAIGWWRWWKDQRNTALPPDIAASYLRQADESLTRHHRSPEDTCDWCTATRGTVITYPCFPAQLATTIKETYSQPQSST